MITTRIDGEQVGCGRPGCPELLGHTTNRRRIRLRGHGWHYDEAVTPSRWRRAQRLRGQAKVEVRDRWAAYLPGGPQGYDVGYLAVVECPRCKTPQRIDG